MRAFVLGDIHGAYRAMIQCFQRSEFNPAEDRLIVLGDVCDGYPEVKQSIEELLKIKHCDYIIGNHDLWTLDWAVKGIKEDDWLKQGGEETIFSYGPDGMPAEHVRFLKNANLWIAERNRLFVHGGIDPALPLKNQLLETLVWDRDLVHSAQEMSGITPEFQFTAFTEIFVGHTTTQIFGESRPLHFCNVWMLDTGAGWSGKLTIMDMETKEYWQSDFTRVLYPQHGRKRF